MKFLLVLLATCSTMAFGQEQRAGSTLSIETPGMGAFASLNYDYLFCHTEKGALDVKAGLGFYHSNPALPINLVIPFAATYNLKIGGRNHFAELGAAMNIVFYRAYVNGKTDTDSYNWFSPQLGYRSISKKGLQFRAFLIYPYSNSDDYPYWVGNYPWPVVSLGKVLKWKNQ